MRGAVPRDDSERPESTCGIHAGLGVATGIEITNRCTEWVTRAESDIANLPESFGTEFAQPDPFPFVTRPGFDVATQPPCQGASTGDSKALNFAVMGFSYVCGFEVLPVPSEDAARAVLTVPRP